MTTTMTTTTTTTAMRMMNESSVVNKYTSEIPDAERYIETVVLAVIATVSMLANVSLWMVILGTRSLRKESNMLLLLSLSLADLLVSSLSMPFTVVTIALARWIFAEQTCTVMGFLNMLTLVSSVMSLGLISINRYIKICRPRHYRKVYTSPHIFLMTLGVWFLSAVLASPPLYGWCRYDYLPRQSFCFCDWSTSVTYTFFMVSVCFGGPLFMMTVCNVRILQNFRRSQRRLQQRPMPNGGAENEKPSSVSVNISALRLSVPNTRLPVKEDLNAGNTPWGSTFPFTSHPVRVEVTAPQDENTNLDSTVGELYSRSDQPQAEETSIVDDSAERQSDDDMFVSELTTMTPLASARSSSNITDKKISLHIITNSSPSTSSQPNTFSVPEQRRDTARISQVSVLQQQQKREKQRAEEFQLAVSLMVVVVVFVLCWFPFCVTMFVSVFAPHNLPRAADMFTLLLGYSNSCLNPIIYGVMNKRVKQGYRSLWAAVGSCCQSGHSSGLSRPCLASNAPSDLES